MHDFLHTFDDVKRERQEAMVIHEKINPELDCSSKPSQWLPEDQKELLQEEGDKDRPPSLNLINLRANGTIHRSIVTDSGGIQKMDEIKYANLVRPQHHIIAESISLRGHQEESEREREKEELSQDSTTNTGRMLGVDVKHRCN